MQPPSLGIVGWPVVLVRLRPETRLEDDAQATAYAMCLRAEMVFGGPAFVVAPPGSSDMRLCSADTVPTRRSFIAGKAHVGCCCVLPDPAIKKLFQ